MSRVLSVFICLSIILLACNIWAESPHEIAQCRSANQRAHSELVKQFQSARAAGNISQKEAHTFKEMETRLHNIAQRFNSNGLTLHECQQISRQIEHERGIVERMAASPASPVHHGKNPQLAQCRSENQRAHSELLQLCKSARAAGNISHKEAQTFKSMESRLHNIAQRFNSDGFTLEE